MKPLTTVERGLVLAAVRALGPRAIAFLSPRGAHLSDAAALLASNPGAAARELGRLDALPPEGIERVHASWWHKAPPSSRPAARAWLERSAIAHLVPMPAPLPLTPATAPDALDGLGAEALAQLLLDLGRRRVAVAFFEADRGALAQLCARLGEPAASQLLAEVGAVKASHDEVRVAQRALFRLAVEAPDARSLFLSAGARWLAPALAARGGDALQRVAQRLPLGAGTALLAEAGAAATDEDHRYCLVAIAQIVR